MPQDHAQLRALGNQAAAVSVFYFFGTFLAKKKIFQAIRQTSGAYYTVGSAAMTLYPASGGSDDWAKGIANIKYAYTIELRDTGAYGFVLPASYIYPTAQEALAALTTIASTAAAKDEAK